MTNFSPFQAKNWLFLDIFISAILQSLFYNDVGVFKHFCIHDLSYICPILAYLRGIWSFLIVESKNGWFWLFFEKIVKMFILCHSYIIFSLFEGVWCLLTSPKWQHDKKSNFAIFRHFWIWLISPKKSQNFENWLTTRKSQINYLSFAKKTHIKWLRTGWPTYIWKTGLL